MSEENQKSHNEESSKVGQAAFSVVKVLLLIPVIIFSIIGFTLVGIFFYLSDKTLVSLKCEDGYKLELREEGKIAKLFSYSSDEVLYLKKGDQKRKIMLVGTGDNNVQIPQIPKLYEEFQDKYIVKNIHDRQKGSMPGNFEAKEISSTETTQTEFEIIGNCLAKNHDKKEFKLVPRTIVFSKKSLNRITDTTLSCPDKSTIRIQANGKVNFEHFPSQNKSFELGRFNKSDLFSRFSGKIMNSSSAEKELSNSEYLQKEYDPEKHALVQIRIEFTDNKAEKSYTDEQIWPKELANGLFSETGTKDDYLQTCKNSDGKTIFNIFKD